MKKNRAIPTAATATEIITIQSVFLLNRVRLTDKRFVVLYPVSLRSTSAVFDVRLTTKSIYRRSFITDSTIEYSAPVCAGAFFVLRLIF